LSFDEMSYYQRKAIADTMGMDIPQLAMMMANGFDAAVPAAAQSQAEIVALAEEAKKFQNVMDELAQTGRMLAQTLMPLVTLLKSVLNTVQKLVTAFPFLEKVFPPVIFGLGAVYMAARKLNGEFAMKNRNALGFLVVAISLAFAALNADSIALKVVFALLAVGAAYLSYSLWSVAAAGAAAGVATGGIIPILGLVSTVVMGLASIFMHKAASPGFIDILGLVGTAFTLLGFTMGPIVSVFGALTSAIMGSAKAAHDLDGTSVEMTTNTKATASSRASGAISSNAVSVGGTTANKSSGRISSANATAANSIADRYYPQNQDPQAIDVNLLVKQDDKSLVKCIVEVNEQSKHYSNAGMKANPASIRNRLPR